jgi:hypothetical protein
MVSRMFYGNFKKQPILVTYFDKFSTLRVRKKENECSVKFDVNTIFICVGDAQSRSCAIPMTVVYH